MHRSLVKFSGSEASNHAPSLVDFTTTTPELKFSVHTGLCAQNGSIKIDRRIRLDVPKLEEKEKKIAKGLLTSRIKCFRSYAQKL
jgi:hypothetical protein